MTSNEAAKAKAELANAMLEVAEMFEPMLDLAEGQRAILEKRGWSPTAAEAIALQMLQGLISQAFTGIKK